MNARRSHVRVHIVVLAAGASLRFGSNKLLYRMHDNVTLFDRAIAACGSYPMLVVASSQVAAVAQTRGLPFVVNDVPERGMSHSLRLAHAHVPRERALAVLPADLRDATADRVTSVIERAQRADVTYPVRSDGAPGHPVVFSAHARAFIDELPDGDTIRLLRDRKDLSREPLRIDESWPYRDVDVVDDLR